MKNTGYEKLTDTELNEQYKNARKAMFNATQMRKTNVNELHFSIEAMEWEKYNREQGEWRKR